MATTLDSHSNPVIFSIGSDGSVSATLEVPTNQSSTPYKSNGLEPLPGLHADSIAACQLPDGTPVAVATQGPQSWVYINEYLNTPGSPFAHTWTGWQKLSDFVATSITAVSNSGGSGPAIFATGADSNVYEDLFSSTLTPSPFTDFQLLNGLSATSIAAIADGSNTFRIVALIGPQSYVYQDTTTFSNGAIQSAGWTTLNTQFVASSLSISTGPTSPVQGVTSPDTLLVFSTGAGDGSFYFDTLTLDSSTGQRTSGDFTLISPAISSTNPGPSSPASIHSIVESTAVDSGDYLTLFVRTSSNAVYENEYLLTGTGDQTGDWTGWQTILTPSVQNVTERLPIQSISIASTPAYGGGVELLSTDSTYTTGFVVAPAHTALSPTDDTPVDNDFTFEYSLSQFAYHQLVTTLGPNGLTAVFTIGSDGTVYESQNEPSSSSIPTRYQYSAITALPGLSASSITATTEPDGMAVFALVNSRSVVYENQYRPTGNKTYAWTGWQKMSNFVASSIASATAGDSATNGPTVFGIGADGKVYSATSSAPTNSTDPFTFSAFGEMDGITAYSLSATATATAINTPKPA